MRIATKLEEKQLGSFIGMGGIATMAFLYFFSGLVAPLWAVVVLVAIWVVGFALGCRWFMTRPVRVFVVPLVLAVIWFATILVGAQLLGWKA